MKEKLMKQCNNNPGDFGALGANVAKSYQNFISTNINYQISIDSVLSSALLYIFKMKHRKWLRIQTNIGCKNICSPRCSRKRCFLRLPAYLRTTISRESVAKKEQKMTLQKICYFYISPPPAIRALPVHLP